MGNLTNQYISASFDGLLQIETNNTVTNGLGMIPSNFILSTVTASNLSVTSNISSDLIPSTNNTSNLGSTTEAWANVYATNISGTFTGDGSALTGIVATAAPAGPDTSVQFKDGSNTSGSSAFVFNKSTGGVTATSFSGSFSGSFFGDGSGLTGVSATTIAYSNITGKPTLLSGSAQIATDISGSFTSVSSSITTRITTLETKTVYSGSFSGSFEGDGSGLTGVSVTIFPYVGTATITGSLIVSGSATDKTLIQTDVTSSTVVPRTTATFDVGSEALKYRNAYFSGHVSASSGQFGALIASGSSVVISGSLVLPTGSSLTFNNISNKEIVFASGSELESISNLKWDYTTNTGYVTGSWIVSGSSTLKSIGKFVSNGTTEITGTLAANGTSWNLTNVTIVSMSVVSASTYYGDGSNLTNVVAGSIGWSNVSGKPILLSGSAQIATDISGSFTATSASIATNIATNKVNITTNTTNISTLTSVTGSYATTGSVTFTGQVTAVGFSGSFSGSYVGDGSGLTGVTSEWDGTLNGNAQITGSLIVTAGVSGSFSGSFTGNGSNLTNLPYSSLTGTPTLVSSSAQFTTITNPFTGSFTGSFTGDGSGLVNVSAGAGGNNKSFQFNDSSAVSGSTSFEYEKTADLVRATNIFEVSGSTNLSGSTTLTGTVIIKGASEQNAGIYIGDNSAGSVVNPLSTGNNGIFINTSGATFGALVNNSVAIGGDRTGQTLSRDNTVYLPFVESTNVTASGFSGSFVGDGSGLTGYGTNYSSSYALTASIALSIAGGLQDITNNGATTTTNTYFSGALSASLLQIQNLGDNEIPFSNNANGDITNDSAFTYNNGTQTLTVKNINVQDGTTLGSNASDTVSFIGDVDTNILPSADGTKALGDESNRWKVYATSVTGSSFTGSFVGDGSGITNIPSSSLSNVVFTNKGDSAVQSIDGTLKLTGDIIAENYIISSSVSYITQSFSSGSTIFGDTLDDTHQFTGSVDITGSVTANSFIGDGSSLTGYGTSYSASYALTASYIDGGTF